MSFVFLLLFVALSVLKGVTSLRTAPHSVAAAWYTGWHATGTEALPLSKVSWNKYNILIYSFAITTPEVKTLSLDGMDPSFLVNFVAEAHKHNVAAHAGIGGWGGSVHFSSHVATAESRTLFASTVARFVVAYDLDGIEFDWEYPNQQGIGYNTISDADTVNFFLFLKELRDIVGDALTLAAAVSIDPFNDASGKPSTDVSDFAKVLDYIVIMNYDVWSSWSSRVGPNSPLNDTCAAPTQQAGSAVSAVKAWTAAKMPVNKIVLGVPSYGHSFSVSPSDAFVRGSNELAPYPKFDASKQPLGDAWGGSGGVDSHGVKQKPSGTFELWGLVDGGFLDRSGNPSASKDIYYRYDDCSQTPYVYNKTSQVMVSFDNAKSFAAKGKYIKENKLRGFSMWEAGGDFNDILLDSIRNATRST